MNKYEKALQNFGLNLTDEAVSRKAADIIRTARENYRPEILRFLYSCIDLTSLGSDDSRERIWQWTEAVNAFEDAHDGLPNVAALCVYPNRVETVRDVLRADVRVASVAGGFPSSQTFQEIKIAEVALAVVKGADEIDVVISAADLADRNYAAVAEEIIELKAACRSARLKVILETGLLTTAARIQEAAVLAMYAGADFLKTSTGKGYPGATPEAVCVLCEAIGQYFRLHRRQVGIKISGGVRTAEEAVLYYTLVKELLGLQWLTPEYFRIGASSLADNLLSEIERL
jgi:deoxyribose-phosphate aldolase